MILIEKMWTEDLLDITFNSGYDIRIHGVQTALNLLLRRADNLSQRMGSINFSPRVFGEYDSETEDCIKAYQGAVGLPRTGELDPQTFVGIFLNLRVELNSIVVKHSPRMVKICDAGNYVDLLGDDINNGVDNSISKLEDKLEGRTENFDIESLVNNSLIVGNPPTYGATSLLSKIKDTINNFLNDKFLGIDGNKTPGEEPSLSDRILSAFAYDSPSFGYGGYREGVGSPAYSNVTMDNENDYIANLLANSIYEGNFDYDRPIVWDSKTKTNINIDGYEYDKSLKYETFFSNKNTSPGRRSNYDITIVYGANGQFAKQILGVIPRAKSQQLDASGEAIYDVIEFIAKDIVETDNRRK